MAVENLRTYIKIYYGDDENCDIYNDELELNRLKNEVIQKAAEVDAESVDFIKLSERITELKKSIAHKQKLQSGCNDNKNRSSDVTNLLNTLKNQPIEYDDYLVRKIVEQIYVISKHELKIVFKGGIEVSVDMD